MKGFTFDPSRLREHLGGDPLAEFRRKARRDPALRAMLAQAAAELALAAAQIEPHGRKDDDDDDDDERA